MKLTKRLSKLGNDNSFVVLAEVTKLREQGRRSIINFEINEPDFNTPPNIENAGINAINKNINQYIISKDIPDFRREYA